MRNCISYVKYLIFDFFKKWEAEHYRACGKVTTRQAFVIFYYSLKWSLLFFDVGKERMTIRSYSFLTPLPGIYASSTPCSRPDQCRQLFTPAQRLAIPGTSTQTVGAVKSLSPVSRHADTASSYQYSPSGCRRRSPSRLWNLRLVTSSAYHKALTTETVPRHSDWLAALQYRLQNGAHRRHPLISAVALNWTGTEWCS